jgi:hypothetical protein
MGIQKGAIFVRDGSIMQNLKLKITEYKLIENASMR